jgi:hypothetical protein
MANKNTAVGRAGNGLRGKRGTCIVPPSRPQWAGAPGAGPARLVCSRELRGWHADLPVTEAIQLDRERRDEHGVACCLAALAGLVEGQGKPERAAHLLGQPTPSAPPRAWPRRGGTSGCGGCATEDDSEAQARS